MSLEQFYYREARKGSETDFRVPFGYMYLLKRTASPFGETTQVLPILFRNNDGSRLYPQAIRINPLNQKIELLPPEEKIAILPPSSAKFPPDRRKCLFLSNPKLEIENSRPISHPQARRNVDFFEESLARKGLIPEGITFSSQDACFVVTPSPLFRALRLKDPRIKTLYSLFSLIKAPYGHSRYQTHSLGKANIPPEAAVKILTDNLIQAGYTEKRGVSSGKHGSSLEAAFQLIADEFWKFMDAFEGSPAADDALLFGVTVFLVGIFVAPAAAAIAANASAAASAAATETASKASL